MMYVNGRPANTDSIYHIRRSSDRKHRIGDSDMTVVMMMTAMMKMTAMIMAMMRGWWRGCTSTNTSRGGYGVVRVDSNDSIHIHILLLLSPNCRWYRCRCRCRCRCRWCWCWCRHFFFTCYFYSFPAASAVRHITGMYFCCCGLLLLFFFFFVGVVFYFPMSARIEIEIPLAGRPGCASMYTFPGHWRVLYAEIWGDCDPLQSHYTLSINSGHWWSTQQSRIVGVFWGLLLPLPLLPSGVVVFSFNGSCSSC